MEYRLLGRSGLKVSTLSVGTVTFGGDGLWGDTDMKGGLRSHVNTTSAGRAKPLRAPFARVRTQAIPASASQMRPGPESHSENPHEDPSET